MFKHVIRNYAQAVSCRVDKSSGNKGLKALERYQIHHVLIPENYTNTLQPLDVALNKPVKDFMKAKFQKWYVEQVAKQLKDSAGTQPVDMWLTHLFRSL